MAHQFLLVRSLNLPLSPSSYEPGPEAPPCQLLNYLISSQVFHVSLKGTQDPALWVVGKQPGLVHVLPFLSCPYHLILLQAWGQEVSRAVFEEVTF